MMATTVWTFTFPTWPRPEPAVSQRGHGAFRDVAPELGVTGAQLHLRLPVLGLRQRRPARPLCQRQYVHVCSRRRGHLPGHEPTTAPLSPALPQPRHEGFRDVTREPGWTGPLTTHGLQLRRHRQRRLSLMSTSEPAGCRSRASFPTSCSRTSRGDDSRMSPCRPAPATSKRPRRVFADYNDDGALDLFVQTGGATPGRSGPQLACSRIRATAATGWPPNLSVQRPTGAAHRWPDQGDHQPDRRPDRTIDLPHRREQFQLRRQHAGPIDR